MSDGEVIKTDFMVKRSQMRGIFKAENFRSRWFVLTNSVLRYHEGALEGNIFPPYQNEKKKKIANLKTSPGKEKGRIPLADVRAVEEVDSEALSNKPNAFQVVYQDTVARDWFVLYIVALHSGQRTEWMDLIRNASEQCQARFSTRFHSGVYNTKRRAYTCCGSIDRYCEGCSPNTFSPQPNPSPVSSRTGSSSSTPSDNNHKSVSLQESTPANRRLPSVPREIVEKPKPPPILQKKMAIALYDYQKADSGDLCLKKGEQYEIIDDSNENWWLARSRRTGEEGYVPSNYVQEKTESGIETYDWYYRNTTRLTSEDILKKDGRDGTFLVRDSSQVGMFTLSILTHDTPQGSGVVRHYHIKKNSTKLYYLSDNHSFDNIPDLIFYHKHNSAGLIIRLRSPPSEGASDQPPTAGFGHGIKEIDRNDLQMLEHLGSGQFGTVKKALYMPKNMEVAVKMMQANTMSEADFVLEATTMQQLTHPNLVQLYGVCSATPIYIITEFMKHGALLQYLRRHKSRLLEHPGKLLDMCVQVCSAMKYLESHQFLHRDLAARNCLVGDNNVIKVGDFGLTRFVLDDDYTSSSGTKFPIKWASPEVLQYTRFSSKSDVWAFGILMWEIFAGGDMPYKGIKNPDVINQVVTQRKRLDCPRECPSAVYEVMRKCWEMLADRRPPFKDLYEDLLKLQEEREYVG